MRRTVVELDLIGYSDIARELEENLSVDVVTILDEQIQAFVDQGLLAVGKQRDGVVMGTSGDNAILVLERPADAHVLAEAVHRATQDHNAGRSTDLAKRRFRIGAATGEVDLSTREGRRSIAGTVIINAVRLEASAGVGQLLVDIPTYDALPEELRRHYGPEEKVKGKRNETLLARRCQMVPGSAPTTYRTDPTAESVLSLFDRLNPRDQLDRVAIMIGMPPEHRPSPTLSVAQRQNAIVDWATHEPGGLGKLDARLSELIPKPSHP